MYLIPSRLQPRLFPLVVLLIAPLLAGVEAASGAAGGGPGASLLFPYFEADLTDFQGRKTLISIQNTSAETVLTNVVFWTNCGLPVLSFNLVIEAHAVRPIDVGAVIASGKIPASGAGTPFADCGVPASHPGLDEAQVRTLQARLTGQPDPDDGLCYSEAVEPATMAVGYVTVDVVHGCSDSIRTPHDEGYFTSDGVTGLADDANVLWGDVLLLDDQGNQAQGFEAVALVADAQISESSDGGFYRRGDDRRPLGSRYRTRFLQGGSFDGGTELLVWVAPRTWGAFECGGPAYRCGLGNFQVYSADSLARRESGEEVSLDNPFFETTATRLAIGAEALPIEARFGTLDLQFYFWTCKSGKCSPPGRGPVQAWVLPIYTAGGRFSVGLNAVALDDTGSE